MKKSFLVLASLMLIVTACQKDKPVEKVESNETKIQTLDDFYKNNLDDRTQTFIIDANSPIFITGKKGNTLTIPANNFLDGTGQIIEGDIEVTLIEITTKADMFMVNKPTVTANNEALISGGEFYVNVTLPNSDETLRQIDFMKLDVPNENPDLDMKLWVDDGDGWILAKADERAPDGILELYDAGYIASIESGWFNLDKIMNFPGDPTTLDIIVPKYSEPKFTSVFISVDYENTILIVEDMYYNGLDTYNCPEVPAGLKVHIGVIQMDPITENNMYDIKPLKIPIAGSIDFSKLLYGSIKGLDADMDNLP